MKNREKEQSVPPALVVTGGKGGVGKSTVAAGLARALSRQGVRAGLLDADLTGPSQHLLFPGEELRSNGKRLVSSAKCGIPVASLGMLMERDTPIVFNRHTVWGTLLQLIEDVDWSACSVLVVDTPPGAGDVHTRLRDILGRQTWIVVSTGSDLATADCRRCLSLLARIEVNVLGLVENFAFDKCEHCGAERSLFERNALKQVASEAGLRLLARLPWATGVAHGKGMRELTRAATRWLEDENDP